MPHAGNFGASMDPHDLNIREQLTPVAFQSLPVGA